MPQLRSRLFEPAPLKGSPWHILSDRLLPSGASEVEVEIPAAGEKTFRANQALGVGRLLWLSIDPYKWVVSSIEEDVLMAG